MLARPNLFAHQKSELRRTISSLLHPIFIVIQSIISCSAWRKKRVKICLCSPLMSSMGDEKASFERMNAFHNNIRFFFLGFLLAARVQNGEDLYWQSFWDVLNRINENWFSSFFLFQTNMLESIRHHLEGRRQIGEGKRDARFF